METKDAMVDGWILPTNMLQTMVSLQEKITHTLLRINHARMLKENSKELLDMLIWTAVKKFKKLSKNNPLLLQSMPQTGVSMVIIYFIFLAGGTKPFSNCKTNLNHGVILVGVSEDGVWKIRNSWGTSWGNSGHMYIAAGNTCGICIAASYPILVWVS